ncbi:MAG: DUF4430 domain-containing protein [Erysipelotrichaceae bacterium]|nr:DUF4430 domain-containing protein [Erysipelotrichaceae bacterium]
MKMMKLLLSALLMFVICGCSKPASSGEMEHVSILLTIEDAVHQTQLFEGEVSAEGVNLTLEDVLTANAEKLQLMTEKKAYGMQINGLMGVETTDWDKGPWWMYTSDNNESCVEAGYCLGASELEVADGDKFTFTFSTGY